MVYSVRDYGESSISGTQPGMRHLDDSAREMSNGMDNLNVTGTLLDNASALGVDLIAQAKVNIAKLLTTQSAESMREEQKSTALSSYISTWPSSKNKDIAINTTPYKVL